MAKGSPFQKNPERFGFKLGGNIRLYCQSEFDESGGLRWEDKAVHNLQTNQHIRSFIDSLKGSPKHTGSRMEDSHLLMYLYRNLGHQRKRLIEEIYETAYTVNPHVVSAHAHLAGQLADRASRLNAILRRSGFSMDLRPPGSEDFSFSLSKGAVSVRCSLRARSEDVLLNAANNRVHGDQFVMHTDFMGAALLGNPTLQKFMSSSGASLAIAQPAAGSESSIAVTMTAGEMSARFTVDLVGPQPSVRCEEPAGRPGPDRKLLDDFGRLLLAFAVLSRREAITAAGAVAQMKKRLPEILRIAESWDL